MSMRVRNLNVASAGYRQRFQCQSQYLLSGNWINTVSQDLYPDYTGICNGVKWTMKRIEDMQDCNNGRHKRPFSLVCQHTKVDPARFDSDSFKRSSTVYLDSRNRVQISQSAVDGSVFAVPSESASLITSIGGMTGDVDWFPLVTALGQQVKGIVDSKSLLGVTFRELPQTIRMVRNPFGLLKGDWRSFARNLSGKQLAKGGANLWLEYQYGWKAAYNDVITFAKTLAKLQSELYKYKNTTGRQCSRTSTKVQSAPSPTVSDEAWSAIKNDVAVNGYRTHYPAARIVFDSPIVQARISCYASDRLNDSMSSLERSLHAFGLTADEVVDTLWESLPYSFVVDWFVNTDRILHYPQFKESIRTLTSAEVSNLGYATKVTLPYRVDLMANAVHDSMAIAYGQHGVGSNEIKAHGSITIFTRRAGLPSDINASIWNSAGLSLTKTASGVALILQRIFKR